MEWVLVSYSMSFNLFKQSQTHFKTHPRLSKSDSLTYHLQNCNKPYNIPSWCMCVCVCVCVTHIYCPVIMSWDGLCLCMTIVVYTVGTQWQHRCHCWWIWTQSIMVNPFNLDDTRSPCQVTMDPLLLSKPLSWSRWQTDLVDFGRRGSTLWCYFGIPDQASGHLFLLLTFYMIRTLIRFSFTVKVQEWNLSQDTPVVFLWDVM